MNRNIDLKKATNLAEDTILEIKKLRQNANTEFKILFSKAEKQAEKCDFFLTNPELSTNIHRDTMQRFLLQKIIIVYLYIFHI